MKSAGITIGMLLGSAATANADDLRLHLANQFGIHEVTSTLAPVRTLTKTRARWERYTQNRSAIVFIDQAYNLRWLDIATGQASERTIAKLPRSYAVCKHDDQAARVFTIDELEVEPDSRFSVDNDGKKATLQMQDRNDNMANYMVELTIDLVTSGIEWEWQLPKCAGKHTIAKTLRATVTPAPIPMMKPTPAPVAPKPFVAKFDLADGWIVKITDGKKRKVAQLNDDFHVWNRSQPNGRYLLIAGNTDNEDYIYNHGFFLDRETGDLFTIDDARWIKVAPAAVHANTEKGIELVGESTVVWLTPTLLQIDQTLIIPGERMRNFDGDLVQ